MKIEKIIIDWFDSYKQDLLYIVEDVEMFTTNRNDSDFSNILEDKTEKLRNIDIISYDDKQKIVDKNKVSYDVVDTILWNLELDYFDENRFDINVWTDILDENDEYVEEDIINNILLDIKDKINYSIVYCRWYTQSEWDDYLIIYQYNIKNNKKKEIEEKLKNLFKTDIYEKRILLRETIEKDWKVFKTDWEVEDYKTEDTDDEKIIEEYKEYKCISIDDEYTFNN